MSWLSTSKKGAADGTHGGYEEKNRDMNTGDLGKCNQNSLNSSFHLVYLLTSFASVTKLPLE